jgi:translation elongation factor EF-4
MEGDSVSKTSVPSAKRLKANRKYKSSVFASYFSETNQRLIDLYNAFSKVEYPEDTPLEINTLDSALFYGLINVISFVLNNMLIVLIEH